MIDANGVTDARHCVDFAIFPKLSNAVTAAAAIMAIKMIISLPRQSASDAPMKLRAVQAALQNVANSRRLPISRCPFTNKR
ncbi:hypothetical protein [Sphingomonas sp. 28-63-12]|uniref:hypothetical protein n=1 Tax=Sphingomonas sp. 28-63-12 TaxID=1970434 RepID=UPI0035A896C2